MEHLVCLNTNSFPANTPAEGYTLFEEALQGLLQLNGGADRFTLYIDSNIENFADFLIAESFTYQDFLTKLHEENEQDMLLFLTEIDDKTPALDHLEEDVFNQLTEYTFYIPGHATAQFPDILSLAFFTNATMLSINTGEPWERSKIPVARTSDGSFTVETLSVKNISSEQHGIELFELLSNIDIIEICGKNLVTKDFHDWFNGLKDENKHRVADKMRLAVEREFKGGKPLFDTLNDAEGLREVRFSAHAGGAIRVLFKALSDSKHAVLVGFIKKSDGEGYKYNIARANELMESI
ncbi:type II toxin-antitoxin system RelE/ParE family toxin [Pseudomonas kurunegalensis]|uniref:type II toxin-antitoxin system RelE/ParE family toxin n=1 Tax=Pseudomonas kurunegalensis TaxID=485880 RepID=UPI002363D537|nr:type II toxin-antitoxin system RelE/ParE family toxin [Pseudomonas kurunegalensis]MDD2133473.1 type II toxin-antitoxin system RelE/ParE family toxin [Pseudomonas kurunegalensis]